MKGHTSLSSGLGILLCSYIDSVVWQKIKETIIWIKMLYQTSAGYLTDSVTGGILGASIALGNYSVAFLILGLRLTVGVIVIKLGMVQLENEMSMKALNPYMDGLLNEKKKKKS